MTYSLIELDSAEKCARVSDLLKISRLCKSNTEAKTLIADKGCKLNDVLVEKDREVTTDDFLHGKYVVLKKGKKSYFIFKFN